MLLVFGIVDSTMKHLPTGWELKIIKIGNDHGAKPGRRSTDGLPLALTGCSLRKHAT